MNILAREHPLEVFRRIDWWIVLVVMAIAFLGLVFIHSATRYDPRFEGQHLRQTLFFAMSGGMAAVVILIPYPRVMRMAWVLYAAILVALLLLPFFGTTINGARRWYRFPGFAVQPAEFAKFATCMAVAKYLSLLNIKMSNFKTKLVCGALITIPMALILLQGGAGLFHTTAGPVQRWDCLDT